MKKGELSKFIDQAVRANVFHRTIQDIKERNADTDPDELQAPIDETYDADLRRATRRVAGNAA